MAQVLLDESCVFFSQYKNDVSRNAYIKNYKKFIDFCRKNYNCKSKAECEEYIQDYVAYLVKSDKSAATIHTYLAPICAYHKISMAEIEKPIRKISDIKRSRNRDNRMIRSGQNYKNDKFKHLVCFQTAVGIRRAELKKIQYDDLVVDESGYTCIRVKRGKGAKMQLQRILPEDVDMVKEYFNTPGTGRLFKESDFDNKLDLHHLRALQAQRAYKYYYNLLHTGNKAKDKETADVFVEELKKRWDLYNKSKDGKTRKYPRSFTGVYKLRGDNRRKALSNGFAVEYDRLAVYMVSVFHLSHWRCDVTVDNYLVAK